MDLPMNGELPNNEQENSNSTFKIPQQFVAAEFTNLLDLEITTQELYEKWQKTKNVIIGKIDTETNSSQKKLTRKIKRF